MLNVYTLLSGVVLIALAVLVTVVRRAAGRGTDLMNVSVSRQWLVQHQSHDRP